MSVSVSMSDFTGSYSLMTDTDEASSPVTISPQPGTVAGGAVEEAPGSDSDTASEENGPGALLTTRAPKNSILKRKAAPLRYDLGVRSNNPTGSIDGSNEVVRSNRSKVTFTEEDENDDDGSEDQILQEIEEESLSPSTVVLRKVPKKKHAPLQKLKSNLDFVQLGKNETELKANLFFHIGNPIKRWRIERVIPIKLILQLVKTVFLVIQVSLFTVTIPNERAEFFYNSREVFENHFLLGVENEPARGIYTVFSIDDILARFDHICENYYRLPYITIGGYDFQISPSDNAPEPVQMTLRQYAEVEINASTFTYVLNGRLRTVIFNISKDQVASEEYIKHSNDSQFNRFMDLVVSFPVNNIRIVHKSKAECFAFRISITFMSVHDSGKILYFLRQTHGERPCNDTIITDSASLKGWLAFLTILDITMVILSFLSVLLIFGTLKRAIKLGRAMGAFYAEQLHIHISWWERRSLFSKWHFLNFCCDLFIITGSVCQIALDMEVVYLASATRILLGTAVLLQAGVVLRYASYFKELNALNRTLYLAFPELLKFMLCAGLLFMAFSLSGCIVLGPFHPKFVDFYETVETLFGLLNGDGIYDALDEIDKDDNIIAYVYSRAFIYAFIVLFIYFVLNLFTSLVISAYEASQQVDNASKNEVRRFVFSGPLTPNGVALRDVTLTKKYVDPQVILRRRKKKPQRKFSKSYTFLESLSPAAQYYFCLKPIRTTIYVYHVE